MAKKRTMQPIKNIEVIQDIRDYLKVRSERDHLLFTFGIYTGFRISDMIKLKVRDAKVFIEDGTVYRKENKTSNEREIDLNPALEKVLKEYIKGKKDYEYLFLSRKTNDGVGKPITREHAGRILKKAAKQFGLKRINTHSMRKTFGYFLYINGGEDDDKNLAKVMRALGHSDPNITLTYIGVSEESVNESIMKLDFEIKKKRK